MNVARALGLSGKPTGLPASKPQPQGEARWWKVPGVLELEFDVWAGTAGEAAALARDALRDVQAHVDALPGVWGAGGDLSQPREVKQ